MSKMRTKAAAVLLAVSLAACAATACGADNRQESSVPPAQTSVLLSGFDSNEELLTMLFSGLRAKIELSDEHVTEGEKSAKLTLIGKQSATGEYYQDNEFYILPGNRFLSKMDYSDVVQYSVDIFNGSEKSYEMAFGYNHLRMNSDTYLLGRRTLQPGANHLVFDVNNNVIKTFVDVTAVKDFAFYIDGRELDDSVPVFYIDNLRAEVRPHESKAHAIGSKIDFSDEADFHKFSDFGASTGLLRCPKFEKNTDLRYVWEGKESLRVEFQAKKGGDGVDCAGFRVKDDMLKIPADCDLSDTYLEYRLYNDTDNEITVRASVFTHVASDYYSWVSTVQPHSWVAAGNSVLLQTLDDAFAGNGLGNLMCIGFEIGGLTTAGSCVYLDGIVLTKKS